MPSPTHDERVAAMRQRPTLEGPGIFESYFGPMAKKAVETLGPKIKATASALIPDPVGNWFTDLITGAKANLEDSTLGSLHTQSEDARNAAKRQMSPEAYQNLKADALAGRDTMSGFDPSAGTNVLGVYDQYKGNPIAEFMGGAEPAAAAHGVNAMGDLIGNPEFFKGLYKKAKALLEELHAAGMKHFTIEDAIAHVKQAEPTLPGGEFKDLGPLNMEGLSNSQQLERETFRAGPGTPGKMTPDPHFVETPHPDEPDNFTNALDDLYGDLMDENPQFGPASRRMYAANPSQAVSDMSSITHVNKVRERYGLDPLTPAEHKQVLDKYNIKPRLSGEDRADFIKRHNELGGNYEDNFPNMDDEFTRIMEERNRFDPEVPQTYERGLDRTRPEVNLIEGGLKPGSQFGELREAENLRRSAENRKLREFIDNIGDPAKQQQAIEEARAKRRPEDNLSAGARKELREQKLYADMELTDYKPTSSDPKHWEDIKDNLADPLSKKLMEKFNGMDPEKLKNMGTEDFYNEVFRSSVDIKRLAKELKTTPEKIRDGLLYLSEDAVFDPFLHGAAGSPGGLEPLQIDAEGMGIIRDIIDKHAPAGPKFEYTGFQDASWRKKGPKSWHEWRITEDWTDPKTGKTITKGNYSDHRLREMGIEPPEPPKKK